MKRSEKAGDRCVWLGSPECWMARIGREIGSAMGRGAGSAMGRGAGSTTVRK